MFMLRLLHGSGRGSKPRSSAVYDEEKGAEEFGRSVEDDEGACTSLTVWRKSLLPSCSGFTVIDSKGSLVYRVDNYTGRPEEVVLMDGNGRSILTNRRRKGIRIVDDWLVYQGEASENNVESLLKRSTSTNYKQTPKKHHQPVYSVKKPINILQPNSSKSNVLAHVYLVGSQAPDYHHHHQNGRKRSPAYVIEGSYCQRSCKVVECFDGDRSSKTRRRKVIAEIKRKEAINGCASFGSEVFKLIVWPGFDPATAMALILLLDQMFT